MSSALFAPVDPAKATPAQAAFLAAAPPIAVARVLAHAPPLAEPVFQVGAALLCGDLIGLPVALREALIVRVGRVRGAEYVELQHRLIAAHVGLSEPAIEAAAHGSSHPALPPHWRAAFRVLEAALAGQAADRADIDAVVREHETYGIVSILVVAGFFGLLAGVASALDLPVDPPVA